MSKSIGEKYICEICGVEFESWSCYFTYFYDIHFKKDIIKERIKNIKNEGRFEIKKGKETFIFTNNEIYYLDKNDSSMVKYCWEFYCGVDGMYVEKSGWYVLYKYVVEDETDEHRVMPVEEYIDNLKEAVSKITEEFSGIE